MVYAAYPMRPSVGAGLLQEAMMKPLEAIKSVNPVEILLILAFAALFLGLSIPGFVPVR
jgi:hypothetical protein